MLNGLHANFKLIVFTTLNGHHCITVKKNLVETHIKKWFIALSKNIMIASKYLPTLRRQTWLSGKEWPDDFPVKHLIYPFIGDFPASHSSPFSFCVSN